MNEPHPHLFKLPLVFVNLIPGIVVPAIVVVVRSRTVIDGATRIVAEDHMYTIWMPFDLQSSHDFDLDEPVEIEVCGYPSRLVRQLGHAGLSIPDEDTARAVLASSASSSNRVPFTTKTIATRCNNLSVP